MDVSLLFNEVNQIIEKGQGLSHYQLVVRLLCGEQWVDPLKVVAYSIERDYIGGYGESVILELMVGLGTYAYRVFPHRDDLKVDITFIPLYENSDSPRAATTRQVVRYQAVLMEQENPALVSKRPQSASEEDLNRTDVKFVQFQLLDPGLAQVRLISVGRAFRRVTPMDALFTLLTETTALTNQKGQALIEGVTRVGNYNQTTREHLVIPHGTPLSKVPGLLQDNEGGVFAQGLGCFLQDRQWWIYPLFDTTRFSHDARAITVINVPANRFVDAERTYRLDGEHLVIVTGGDTKSEDEGFYQQLNHGNAVRVTRANDLLGDFSQTTNNKVTLNRQKNLFEFEGPSLPGDYTNAQWAPEGATSNPFPHYSQMAGRNGRVIAVEWRHGDSRYLKPGMAIKYMSVAENELVIRYGVLLGVFEQRVPREGGAITKQYPASVALKLFITRDQGI